MTIFKKLIAVSVWAGALAFAAAAHAQTGQLPPWRWADVGVVGIPGYVTQEPNARLLVAGAGSNIWGTADSFFYVYQNIRDGGITVSPESETNTSPFAKAGVMIRQTLDPSSPEVILDVKPDGGIEFMTRSSQGGETTFIAGGSVPLRSDFPMFSLQLNLSRVGTTVYASYCGGDSGDCVDLGSTSFPQGPALIGLAVTSQNSSQLNQAHFFLPTVTSVPYPWSTLDIGAVGTTGEATYDGATGTFFVSGDGSDIWGPADSFRAVTQGLIGDSQLTARVVREDGTNPFAKAGLTISTDSSAGAARVILDVKPDGGIEFMARSTAGGSMSFLAGFPVTFPVWLRLRRIGDQFVGEVSMDDASWISLGNVTVPMPSTNILGMIPGGFAVTSHDAGALNNAVFDNVAVTTGIPGPVGPNLLVNAGFEDSVVPAVGPGWVSDVPFRQTPAVSETSSPHTGTHNAACHTTSGDCGIYQDVSPSADNAGNMLFSVYARADHPGGLVGVNVNGQPVAGASVFVGGYQRYTFGFCTCSVPSSSSTPVIRVWMYAPPGDVVDIDDAALVQYFGPR
jgi:hypothetical protein